MMGYYHIIQYLLHIFAARHTNGFGVHSPFLFNFTQSAIYGKYPYYCYSTIEQYRHKLLSCSQSLYVEDFGTGPTGKKNISSIAKRSLKSAKYGQLFFRIIQYIKASNILELGTSLGVTTCYMAAGNSQAKCTTIEGSTEILKIAKNNFKQLNFDNIIPVQGNINEVLPLVLENFVKLDCVLFDANHTKEATLLYFEQCLPKCHEQTVLIFDDIHRSKQMYSTWKEIQLNNAVTATIDLFEVGIVFFDPHLQKKHYKMWF